MGYQATAGIGTAFDAARRVVEDPCLVPVSSMVLRLHQLEQSAPSAAKRPTQAAPPAGAPAKGVGLCYAVKPLRAVLWVRQRPWVLPIGALGIVGGLIAVGYALGSQRKEKRA